MTRPGGPIADAECEALFSGLAGLERLGVAVSGGPDSTALLFMLHRWSRSRGGYPGLNVLTVDHGLRPGSRGECETVVRFSESLGIASSILTWDHAAGPPLSDVQAAAREARYTLLADAAGAVGIHTVALGHTLDDKAETFLMRLARGSGLGGLAAMAPERTIGGISFVRPLLGVPKERLKATLHASGVPWLEDPSNDEADRFLRARVRALMPALADIGLTPDRLAATADRLARAAVAVDRATDALAREALREHGGVISIETAALLDAPDETALRLLAMAHRGIRPSRYPPRAAVLERMLADLRASPGTIRRRTTGRVVLDPRPDRLWLYAEAGRRGFPVLVVDRPGTHVWDGRFRIVVARAPQCPVTIRAARGDERRTDLPRRAAGSLPVVDGGEQTEPREAWSPGLDIRPVTQV